MKNPCGNCPFRKGNVWIGGGDAKILALKETARQGVFSCHVIHPDSNIFSLTDMVHDDCVGFKQMKENLLTPEKHPKVVNGFNETGPEVIDLIHWFRTNSNDTNLLKLI